MTLEEANELARRINDARNQGMEEGDLLRVPEQIQNEMAAAKKSSEDAAAAKAAAEAEAARQAEIAKRKQYLDQYKSFIQQNLYPTLDKAIAQYQDESVVKTQYADAESKAKRSLAKEYAARGLSGSGSYQTAMGKTIADMSLQLQSAIEQRQNYAMQLQQQKAGYEQQFMQAGLTEDQYQTSLAMAKDQFNKGYDLQTKQFEWNKYMGEQQLEAMKPGFLDTLGGIASIGGTVMGGIASMGMSSAAQAGAKAMGQMASSGGGGMFGSPYGFNGMPYGMR